ncbi:50S ribosomal protein L6 [Candidatus Hodgkinia cicadicola]|nr:50S ribosomal protein L6 [Candidatus Hodgkinia cicadicola]
MIKILIYVVPSGIKFTSDNSVFTVVGNYGRAAAADLNFVVFLKRDRIVLCSVNTCYAAAKLANTIKGTLCGHIRWIRLNGIGYKVKAFAKLLELSLGLSHKLVFNLPQNVESTVIKNNKLKLKSVSLDAVTTVASALSAKKKPDAYRAKGILARGVCSSKHND